MYQASEAKSEPTMATPMAAKTMMPESGSTEAICPPAMWVQLAFQNTARLALMAAALAPTMNPSRMSPERATVLVTVKKPWMVLPVRRPRMLR